MRFGEIALDEAEGAILAHSVAHEGGVLKKGRVLSRADLELIAATGRERIYAARLDASDIHEDEAAARIAEAMAGSHVQVQAPFTGRANIHCDAAGVVVVDVERVNRLNRVHESITIATVPAYETCEPRQLLATVKIIPFAVDRKVLDDVLSVIGEQPLISFRPFRDMRVGLVVSTLPKMKPSILAKARKVTEDRLTAIGASLVAYREVAHDAEKIAEAITQMAGEEVDLLLLLGASAIVDRGDVVPAAVGRAGGSVEHLGMPVDPGNLLMLGRVEDLPVIGVPTCARSPKFNGFDWVLNRIAAGIEVGAMDIMDMGAGGLLKEIMSRPAPRERQKAASPQAPKVAAVLLAAGKSVRMGERNKLLETFDNDPIVRRATNTLLAAGITDVVVVTGHEADRIGDAVEGLPVKLVHNDAFASGMASSLKRGIDAISPGSDAVLVALGDMPFVSNRDIARMISAFSPKDGRSIVVPIYEGQRGNPVLWASKYFDDFKALEGDTGARQLLRRYSDEVCEVSVESSGVITDLDTPEAFAAIKAI